jgi:hypothetical protein
MPEKKKKWNDGWWAEVAKQKKTALPPLVNVRPKKRQSKQK